MSEVEHYWCKNAPNVPRVWSSSSINTIADCPRRFELRYVEGWVPKGGASLDLVFGTGFHLCMEIYWMMRSEWKCDHMEATAYAAQSAMVCGSFLPMSQRTSQKAKTKRNLVRAVCWYLDKYGDELPSANFIKGKIATELNFNLALSLINPDGEPYFIQGYVDLLRDFASQKTVADYKTTGASLTPYYFQRFSPDIQSELYTIGARVYSDDAYAVFMADVICVQVTGVQFQRHTEWFTPLQLEETLLDIEEHIKTAERCAEKKYYPRNTSSCHFCDFREICNKDPVTRETYLNTHFTEERRAFVRRGR